MYGVFCFSTFLRFSDSKLYVWQAPSCAQLIKASLMTITCKTAELFASFYLPTQHGHNIMSFLITEIVADWNQSMKGTDTIVTRVNLSSLNLLGWEHPPFDQDALWHFHTGSGLGLRTTPSSPAIFIKSQRATFSSRFLGARYTLALGGQRCGVRVTPPLARNIVPSSPQTTLRIHSNQG